MSVSTNFYTLHGIKLEWDGEFASAYDAVYAHQDIPSVLIDGMNGEYIILGKILYDSGDIQNGFDGDDFKEIAVSSLAEYEESYKKKFVAKFPSFAHLVDQPFKIITIAHYH